MFLGIDIGSTTSKCALMGEDGQLLALSLVVGGIGTDGPREAEEAVLQQAGIGKEQITLTAATGYGRASWEGADYQVSELTCHGIGARHVFPEVRTIIDIGGQDAKVVALDEDGTMAEFLMNDKCAAGTGRFLDVMASILRMDVDKLGQEALSAQEHARISSTCTVFAESEVISQLAKGVDRKAIVAGICDSVASRTATLAKRIGLKPPVCMSGGVARNSGVRAALEKALGVELLYSPLCQHFGAIGAAIYALRKNQKK